MRGDGDENKRDLKVTSQVIGKGEAVLGGGEGRDPGWLEDV